jgi:integrase
MLFSEYFRGPYAEVADVRGKTMRGYQTSIEGHAMGFLGNRRLEEIDKLLVLRFERDLEKRVSPSVYNHVVSALGAALGTAAELGLIKESPIQGRAARKKMVTPNTRALSPEELRKVVAAAMGEDQFWRCLLLILTFTGCRRGEAIALRWEDLHIDGEMPYVHFAHSVEYVAGRGLTIVDPKTEKSDRECYIPRFLAEDLRGLSGGEPYGFVFCGKAGPDVPLHPGSVNKGVDRFCRKNGIVRFTPHVLRRTLVSILSNREGVGQGTLQSILGHSDTRVLMDFYVKPDDECKRSALEVFVKYCLPGPEAPGGDRGRGGDS